MLSKLVDFALDQRVVTLLLVALLVVFGLYAYRELPVEAFPDVDDVHVQVITQWPGQAAEEIETAITLPLEKELNGTPGLTGLRSVSMFGLSVITLTFEDGVDDTFARGEVFKTVSSVPLPAGVQPQLAALTTSTGEIFRYVIKGPRQKLEELRALQDWVVEPEFRQVPGVADVVAFGGGVKQYQVIVKTELLLQHKVTLQQVFAALQANNANTGGGHLRTGEQMCVIRGVGLLTGENDIRDVCVASNDGRPVFVSDVAEVRTDMAPRQGVVAWFNRREDGTAEEADDIVEGVILQRKGANALKVIEGVKAKFDFINRHKLPAGVRLAVVYDRTELVQQTVHTVMHNLAEGAALVLVILVVFTLSLRGALIVALVIPLSLLTAFLALHLKGIPANLLSFGAVDFGIIVDAAVVIVEAVLVRRWAMGPGGDFREMSRHTSSALGRSILFSKLIIITALVPIFTFQRVEGRIFRPMAYTIAAAIIGATILSVTLVPLACSALLQTSFSPRYNPIVTAMQWVYVRLLGAALRHKWLAFLPALALLAAAGDLSTRLGSEFLPKLDEGNIWLTVSLPLSVSKEDAKDTERRVRAVLKSFPETRVVYAQLGRPDDGTDPKGFNSMEIAVYLSPKETWTSAKTKEELIEKMNDKLQALPGLEFNFSQIIEDNVEEALSGVKGELAIKLFGDDLAKLQEVGEQIRLALSEVRGITDLACEKLSGQPNLTIRLDRRAIARYGLDVQTVLSLIETGLGGKVAGTVLEGQRRFDLSVRLDAARRETAEGIGSLWIDTPAGQRIPLSQLATIRLEEGAARISRDKNSRRIALKAGIRGRDMGSTVEEAQRVVAEKVQLPPGYTVTWEGQFENQQRANARLAIIVPLSGLAVAGILFWAFQRVRYAAMILLMVPFALVGGIAALYYTHTHLSVSAMIGFIALFGASVQNGIVLVGQFNALRHGGMDLRQAVIEGSRERLRPVLMTALMASLGMLPAAMSDGIGSEVQRPLALVIVGGMLSAAALTLVVLPALYEWVESTFPAPVTVPEGLVD
jgi:cobalt-zinc-cadmium resistance protein CzcA